MLIISTHCLSPDELFSYKPINKALGIHFEHVSAIRLYHNQWNIATSINITALQTEWKHLKEMTTKVTTFCTYMNQVIPSQSSTLNIPNNCGPFQAQIKNMLKEIEEYNIDWFHSSSRRQRRGILNIIGEISRELFGTLSQKDAEFFLEHFETLTRAGLERDNLLNKQTTLIQSTFNLVSETINQSELRDTQLQNQITSLNRSIIEIQNHRLTLESIVRAKFQLQDLISFITLLLISFQNKQKNFLQAISSGTRDANSPIIIPPQIFIGELDKIRTILSGKAIDLPFPLSRDTLPLFYRIASPQARIINNQLIIMLTIPLIDTKEYHLYKVTSFPNLLFDNIYQFIIPNHEYVAIDEYREKFVSFTNQELTNCHNVQLKDQDSLLTCMGLSPIMGIKMDRDDCEITLLTKDEVSKHCNVRLSNITSEVWIRLRQHNSWIYVLPTKQMIYIGCIGHQVIEKVLEGTGIITIHEDCNIKTDKILIQAYKVYQQETLLEVTPYGHLDIDINHTLSTLTNIDKNNIKTIHTPSVITFGQNDKLKEVSIGIKELIKMEDEIVNKYSPYKLKEGLNFITVTVKIIFVLVILIIVRTLYKRHKKLQKKRNRFRTRNQITYEPQIIQI